MPSDGENKPNPDLIAVLGASKEGGSNHFMNPIFAGKGSSFYFGRNLKEESPFEIKRKEIERRASAKRGTIKELEGAGLSDIAKLLEESGLSSISEAIEKGVVSVTSEKKEGNARTVEFKIHFSVEISFAIHSNFLPVLEVYRQVYGYINEIRLPLAEKSVPLDSYGVELVLEKDCKKGEINPFHNVIHLYNEGKRKVWVTGAAGTGKTTLFQQAAQAFYKNIEKTGGASKEQNAFDIFIYIAARDLEGKYEKRGKYALLDLITGFNENMESLGKDGEDVTLPWRESSVFGFKNDNKEALITSDHVWELYGLLKGNEHRLILALDGVDEVNLVEEKHWLEPMVGVYGKDRHAVLFSSRGVEQALQEDLFIDNDERKERVINKGLDEEGIKQLITNFFDDSREGNAQTQSKEQMIVNFTTWIHSHSQLSEFIQIPLNCFLLWENYKNPTERFTEITKDIQSLSRYKLFQCITDYWLKVGETRYKPKLMNMFQQKDHRGGELAANIRIKRMKKSWRSLLERIAYTQCVEHGAKPVIKGNIMVPKDILELSKDPNTSQEDIDNRCSLFEEKRQWLIKIGMMRVTKLGKEKEFEFSHLSFMEYYAGCSVAPDDRLDHEKAVKLVEKVYYNTSENSALNFASGKVSEMSPSTPLPWIRTLLKEDTRDYWGAHGLLIFLNCLNEMSQKRGFPLNHIKLRGLLLLWEFEKEHTKINISNDLSHELKQVWVRFYENFGKDERKDLRQSIQREIKIGLTDGASAYENAILNKAKKVLEIMNEELNLGVGVKANLTDESVLDGEWTDIVLGSSQKIRSWLSDEYLQMLNNPVLEQFCTHVYLALDVQKKVFVLHQFFEKSNEQHRFFAKANDLCLKSWSSEGSDAKVLFDQLANDSENLEIVEVYEPLVNVIEKTCLWIFGHQSEENAILLVELLHIASLLDVPYPHRKSLNLNQFLMHPERRYTRQMIYWLIKAIATKKKIFSTDKGLKNIAKDPFIPEVATRYSVHSSIPLLFSITQNMKKPFPDHFKSAFKKLFSNYLEDSKIKDIVKKMPVMSEYVEAGKKGATPEGATDDQSNPSSGESEPKITLERKMDHLLQFIQSTDSDQLEIEGKFAAVFSSTDELSQDEILPLVEFVSGKSVPENCKETIEKCLMSLEREKRDVFRLYLLVAIREKGLEIKDYVTFLLGHACSDEDLSVNEKNFLQNMGENFVKKISDNDLYSTHLKDDLIAFMDVFHQFSQDLFDDFFFALLKNLKSKLEEVKVENAHHSSILQEYGDDDSLDEMEGSNFLEEDLNYIDVQPYRKNLTASQLWLIIRDNALVASFHKRKGPVESNQSEQGFELDGVLFSRIDKLMGLEQPQARVEAIHCLEHAVFINDKAGFAERGVNYILKCLDDSNLIVSKVASEAFLAILGELLKPSDQTLHKALIQVVDKLMDESSLQKNFFVAILLNSWLNGHVPFFDSEKGKDKNRAAFGWKSVKGESLAPLFDTITRLIKMGNINHSLEEITDGEKRNWIGYSKSQFPLVQVLANLYLSNFSRDGADLKASQILGRRYSPQGMTVLRKRLYGWRMPEVVRGRHNADPVFAISDKEVSKHQDSSEYTKRISQERPIGFVDFYQYVCANLKVSLNTFKNVVVIKKDDLMRRVKGLRARDVLSCMLKNSKKEASLLLAMKDETDGEKVVIEKLRRIKDGSTAIVQEIFRLSKWLSQFSFSTKLRSLTFAQINEVSPAGLEAIKAAITNDRRLASDNLLHHVAVGQTETPEHAEGEVHLTSEEWVRRILRQGVTPPGHQP